MNDSNRHMLTLFAEALDADTPQARAAYLDRACGGDNDLRARLEALLKAHGEAGGFLAGAGSAPEPTVDVPTRGDGPGTVIGPYKLLQEIGEGGMGTVYMAEQSQPVQRKVALKIIKPGMDSRQVVARFEAERQALALMDHPNIARVLDAGEVTSDQWPVASKEQEDSQLATGHRPLATFSRPYFVMELVKGVTITKYCDDHRLTPKQRLELFLPVCQAVQHAHQKGIIHRDLKPSNVLVAEYDDKPVAKVIDFGVAKATGPKLTERTMFTELGQVVGTLEYMSPEQAKLNALDIDTRSDIYALGVLLYELLTGTTPFEKKRLQQAAFDEILRVIREEEPPRPSTRLSTTDELPTIAANRGLEPKKLSGVVRGELDWIVMKALEKDRNRRYETANGFAMDVQRYLADEPVLACPPSVGYRLRKFVRRNKAALLMTAAALALVVVAGAGIWSWQRQETLRRAEKDFHAELTRRSVESSLKQLKELHRRALWQQAENLLAQSEQQVGAQGDPALRDKVAQARRDTAFIKELDKIRLDKSVMILEGRWNTAGSLPRYRKVFLDNGFDVLNREPAELAAQMNASEVRDHLLAALDDWAMEDAKNRRRIMAVTAAATGQAWRNQLSTLWEDGARLAEAYDAIPDNERTPAIVCLVALRLAGEDGIQRVEQGLRQYPGDFWLHFNLGNLQSKDRADGAIGAYRAALAVRPHTSGVLNNLGNVLFHKKEYDRAIAEYKEAIRLDPKFAGPHYNLGNVLRISKDHDGAIVGYKEAIRLDPEFAGPHHGLGNVLRAKKEYDAAIAEYKEAMRLDPTSALPHNGLGNVLFDKKEYDAAMTEYMEAIRLDPKSALPHNGLGNVRRAKKEYDAAIAEYEVAIRLDPKFAAPHNGLGTVHYVKKQYDAAIAEYKDAIRLDPKYAMAHNNLGNVLYDKKQYDAAIAEYKDAIRLDPKDALPHNGLGMVLRARKESDAAIAEYKDAIRLDPKYAMPHTGLGNVLIDKKEYDAAIAEFNEAIRLDPKDAAPHNGLGIVLLDRKEHEAAVAELKEAIRLDRTYWFAYANLGMAYRQLGRFSESVMAFTQARKLMPADARLQRQLRVSEQLLALDQQLAAIRQGSAKPKTPAQAIGLADFAMREFKKEYGLAVRLFDAAFAVDARLMAAHRYNAARAAFLAAAGKGKDADKLDDKQQADLRQKALAWLQADLQAHAQSLQDLPSAALLPEKLKHWQSDQALFSVRDAKELAKLPEPEQESWRELWSEVGQLLKKASAAFAETNLKGRLSAKDPEQVHEVKLSAGNTYVIDMTSRDFDTYLRLEDSQKKILAENDDIAPDNLNSRIIFTPKEDGLYRIIATSYQQRARGAYTLTIREFRRKKE